MHAAPSRRDNLEITLQDGCWELRNPTLECLRNITKNFSSELLLGEGGFGQVYKGILENGEMVAVKKLASTILPGVKIRQFENEAHHLMGLRHPNIVLLLGCCSEIVPQLVEHEGKYIVAEKQEMLLCLEYMPKGNLCGYLSDESSGLDWDIRYKIIEGISYGLHHLHEECRIVHMDLKPANILLDNNMVPKIADFGLSRLFSEDQTRTCTQNLLGTRGYMAPEYITDGTITKMSDIFSLGVIIIEIMKGDKKYQDGSREPSPELFENVLNNWSNRLQKSLSYTSLEISCHQIRRCIKIGLACVNLCPSKRPTTSQIIKVLHGSESTDLSGRKVVYQEWASTSEAPHKSISLLVKECQSRKRYIEIDPDCEKGSMIEGEAVRSAKRPLGTMYISEGSRSQLDKTAQKPRSHRMRVYIIVVLFLIKLSSSAERANNFDDTAEWFLHHIRRSEAASRLWATMYNIILFIVKLKRRAAAARVQRMMESARGWTIFPSSLEEHEYSLPRISQDDGECPGLDFFK
ncbi:unnamed protein product [Urochloa humidicola]